MFVPAVLERLFQLKDNVCTQWGSGFALNRESFVALGKSFNIRASLTKQGCSRNCATAWPSSCTYRRPRFRVANRIRILD